MLLNFTYFRGFALNTSAHGFRWTVGTGKLYIGTLW